MDLSTAKKILDLPCEYNILSIKKKYKELAIKYHPDKFKGDTGIFLKINEAYKILLKNENNNQNNQNNKNTQNDEFEIIDKLFELFINSKFTNKLNSTEIIKKIGITQEEYTSGFSRTFNKLIECLECEPIYCEECLCLGYININKICMKCMGCGYYKNCNKCKFGLINKKITIKINENNINLNKVYTFPRNIKIQFYLSE